MRAEKASKTADMIDGDAIITQIKDRRSLQLLRVAGVTNFVISNELSSMIMVHLARTPDLKHFWCARFAHYSRTAQAVACSV